MNTETITNGAASGTTIVDKVPQVAMNRDSLARVLGAVIHAASNDGTRPHLASVLFETDGKGEQLRCVATDGHRLAIAATPCGEGKEWGSLPVGVLVSLESAKALLKAVKPSAKEREQPCYLQVDASGPLTLTLPGAGNLSWPTVDEAFPPYLKVVPKYSRSGTGCIGLSARYIKDAMTAAGLIVRDTNSGGVRVLLGGDRDPVRIEADDEPGGIGATFVIMPMRI